ncbi:helicase HerA domain-containing protein [Mycoplasmopsis pullorum]|uniref:Helicase HerA central domain-containing protein n=1 Tax=Mycoplasmopsis pullorum TaxID=48003 RepID=A0A1L4FSU3_9BACT|nr:DUF87 domain-containing protein [Mycoplasmopsis pullorum]APJ38680.1 hypothetical protein BLA55_03400 [Mycoplasmopsis pullorum]
MKINNPIINISSINDDGTIEIDNKKYVLFDLQGLNFWSFDTHTQEEFIKNIHNLFKSLKLWKFKILKINFENDLKENKQKLKTVIESVIAQYNSAPRSVSEKKILENKIKYFDSVISDIETLESSNEELINKYYILAEINTKESYSFWIREKEDLFQSANLHIQQIKDAGEIEKVFHFLALQPFKQSVQMEEFSDYIKINDKYLWCFRIEDFQSILSDSFLFDFMYYNSVGTQKINTNFIIEYLELDEESKIKMLNKVSRILRYEMDETNKDTEASEIGIEQQALQNLINENAQYKLGFFDCNFIGCISSHDLAELRAIRNKVIFEAKKNGVLINVSKYEQGDLYKHFTLQTLFDLNQSVHTFSTYNIARSWAFLSSYFNDKNYLILGRNRNDGGVLFFDNMLKSEKRMSSSMFFIGKTGSGKTTAIKKFINYHSSKGDSIFLIDPNNDYTKLTLENGGSVVDLSDPLNFKMNVLEIKPELYQDPNTNQIIPTPIKQLINYKIKFLNGLFKLIDPNLENIDLELIERTIKWIFKEKGYYEAEADLSQLDQIRIQDVIDVLKVINLEVLSDFDFSFYSEEQRKGVLRFLHHNFADNGDFEFFNTYDSFEIESTLVSYNMQQLLAKTGGIPTKETSILFYLLIYQISYSVIENLKYNLKTFGMEQQNKWRAIVIVVDEMHKFLGGAAGVLLVDFLFDLIKTLRKYWGLLILGTQSFKDFTLNKEMESKTKQLLEQTQYKFILKVNRDDLESFNNSLSNDSKLLEWEQNYVNNAHQGEALFMCDDTDKYPISFLYNDYEEDLFFTQLSSKTH